MPQYHGGKMKAPGAYLACSDTTQLVGIVGKLIMTGQEEKSLLPTLPLAARVGMEPCLWCLVSKIFGLFLWLLRRSFGKVLSFLYSLVSLGCQPLCPVINNAKKKPMKFTSFSFLQSCGLYLIYIFSPPFRVFLHLDLYTKLEGL